MSILNGTFPYKVDYIETLQDIIASGLAFNIDKLYTFSSVNDFVVNKRQLGKIALQANARKDSGCGELTNTTDSGLTPVELDPDKLRGQFKMCWDDIVGKFGSWKNLPATRALQLDGDALFSTFLSQLVREQLAYDLFRANFAMETAKTINGHTDGVDSWLAKAMTGTGAVVTSDTAYTPSTLMAALTAAIGEVGVDSEIIINGYANSLLLQSIGGMNTPIGITINQLTGELTSFLGKKVVVINDFDTFAKNETTATGASTNMTNFWTSKVKVIVVPMDNFQIGVNTPDYYNFVAGFDHKEALVYVNMPFYYSSVVVDDTLVKVIFEVPAS
jgi:hypothetical protein